MKVEKVMETLEKERCISFWMEKELVKKLRKLVKEKYPEATVEKLSGNEVHFIFVKL
jgi:hypothetical protein